LQVNFTLLLVPNLIERYIMGMKRFGGGGGAGFLLNIAAKDE
jgi:hypothetical protein